MRLRVILDEVLVRIDPALEVEHGLHMPPIARDRRKSGTVVAVGPGYATRRGFRATTLRRGDRVIMTWCAGHDLTVDGVLHTMTREFHHPLGRDDEGILAVIVDEAAA